MAVFPDKIVLKNSSDAEPALLEAIGAGGTDEIVVGEVVVRTTEGAVGFYTRDETGNIVKLGTSASGTCIVSSTEPLLDSSGNDLVDGDMWFNPIDQIFHIRYAGLWLPVLPGSINSLDEVNYSSGVLEIDGLNSLVFDATDQYRTNATAYGMGITARLDGGNDYSALYAHKDRGVMLAAEGGDQQVWISGVMGSGLDGSPELRFTTGDPFLYSEGPRGFSVGFTIDPALAEDTTYTLPLADGTSGQVLATNGSGVLSWANGGSGGGASSIDDLSDVDTSSPGHIPSDGQVLGWDQSMGHWMPVDAAASNLDGLTDVVVPAPNNGDVLSYNGTNWVNTAAPPANISGNSIDDLGDVDTSSVPPTDGQALIWSNADSEWVPGTVSGGGGSSDLPPEEVNGHVLATVSSEWASADLSDLMAGGASSVGSVRLDFEGVGDVPVMSSTGMTSTFPSTDAKFGSGGATFLRSNADYLQGVWPTEIGTQTFTFSFWIKTADTDYSNATSKRIIAPVAGTNLANGFQIMREPTGGNSYTPHSDNAQGAIMLSPGGATGSYLCSTRTAEIADNAWHYVVFQHEGSGVYSCFFDGYLVERRNATSAINFEQNGGFFVGKREDNSANAYFTGSLDNIVLVVGEVASTDTTIPVPTSPEGIGVDYGSGVSIGSLADVDTTTAPPADGNVLAWVDANARWEPMGLGVQDLDNVDVGLDGYDQFDWARKSTYSCACNTEDRGDWSGDGSFIRFNVHDASGVTVPERQAAFESLAPGAVVTIELYDASSTKYYVEIGAITETYEGKTWALSFVDDAERAALMAAFSGYGDGVRLYMVDLSNIPQLDDGDLLRWRAGTSTWIPVAFDSVTGGTFGSG